MLGVQSCWDFGRSNTVKAPSGSKGMCFNSSLWTCEGSECYQIEYEGFHNGGVTREGVGARAPPEFGR